MLAALLPVLALAATSFAAPHEARQEKTPTREACYRKFGASYSVSPVSSVAPVSSVSKASSTAGSAVSSAVVSSKPPVSSASAPAISGASATSKAGIPSASVPASTASVDAFAEQMLKLHNDFRAQYGAGPLKWNTDAAAFAKSHASKCVFAHSSGSGYGENLAAGVGGGYSAATGFNSWANEASLYDYNNPQFSMAAGHFTQVVWKGTTEIGCALVDCPNGSIFDAKYNGVNKFLSCNYKAPGNYQGQFAANVGRKTA